MRPQNNDAKKTTYLKSVCVRASVFRRTLSNRQCATRLIFDVFESDDSVAVECICESHVCDVFLCGYRAASVFNPKRRPPASIAQLPRTAQLLVQAIALVDSKSLLDDAVNAAVAKIASSIGWLLQLGITKARFQHTSK
jgi:hypothetical protein